MYLPQWQDDAFASWFTGGIKAVRFSLSRKYRRALSQQWSAHPEERPAGIFQMVWGSVFDLAILWILVTIFLPR